MDKWNYGISTRELSTGCKAVICMYFFPNKIYGSNTFGNNCWESIVEVAKKWSYIKYSYSFVVR